MPPSRVSSPNPSTMPDSPVLRQITLAHHVLDDSTAHFDLFLGPESPFKPTDRVITTWRLPEDPRALAVGAGFSIEPLPLHIASDLLLEAPRRTTTRPGLLCPLARGVANVHWPTTTLLVLNVIWQSGDPPIEFQIDNAQCRMDRSRMRACK